MVSYWHWQRPSGSTRQIGSRGVSSPDGRRKMFKFTLHVLTSFTSMLSIILFSATIPEWNANFFHASGPVRGDWTDGLPLAPLAMTWLSTLAMLGYTLIKKKSPPPTNAAAALHVVILLFLAIALVLSGLGSVFRFWRAAVVSASGVVECNLTNIFSRQCQPVLYQVGAMQIAGIFFGTMTWLMVFVTLFVGLYERRAMARSLPSATRAAAGTRGGVRRRQSPWKAMLTGGWMGKGGRQDVEKADISTWVGRESRVPVSSEGMFESRPSDRARYGDRTSISTRFQYRAASRQGGEDVLPLAAPAGSLQQQPAPPQQQYPAMRYM